MSTARFVSITLFCIGLVLLTSTDARGYRVSAGAACKKPNSDPDAKRFYNKVDSFPNWSKNFYKKYGKLKEKHYRKYNNRYVDKSDIHYHVGHGGARWDWGNWKKLTAVIFKKGNLVPSEAKKLWGNRNLEWIAFRCCKLLNNKSKGYWANSMNRLHLICGFKTNSYVRNDFGKIWAEQMSHRKKIYQAWFTALDKTNQNGVIARVLAESTSNWNDHLHGYGYVSPDPPIDRWYHYKDHKSGSPPYLQVSNLTEMMVYEVIPQTVDEAYIRAIGNAFGFSMGDPVEDHGDYLLMSQEENPGGDPCDPNLAIHTLEVDVNSGRYYYFNSGSMWPSQPGLVYPTPTSALIIAQGFLNSNGLYPSDAGSSDVEYDTMSTAEGNDITPIETHQIGCGVSFAREIEAFAGETVSVAGAGARLKVYLDTMGDVGGAMGNWRGIQWNGSTVTVLSKEEVCDRLREHGSKVSVEPILVDYDHIDCNLASATLGYYEQPGPDLQTELTPIWILDVNYYDGEDLLTTATTFVPSADEYYPPIAYIVSPGDSSEYDPNETIEFVSSTDPNYGVPPYSYEWSSDVNGVLSTEPNFTGSLSIACVSDGNSTEVVPHVITLKITDSNGRSSSESVEVTIKRLDADINCDRMVDFRDFAHVADRWLESY